ncbi:MAG: hypothetical protein ACLUNQ_05620 [Oscillospiraceae bacterium]
MNQKELNELRRRSGRTAPPSARYTAAMSAAAARSSPMWTRRWACCPRRSRRCT